MPVLNRESDMTANFAQTIDPKTGIIPLLAPLYIFRGHAAADRVAYNTGTASSSGTTTRLWNTTINTLILNGAGFIAWVGCETAGTVTGTIGNMPTVTVDRGATASLGFSQSIYTKQSNSYGYYLVASMLDSGYMVGEAVRYAARGYGSATGLQSWVIAGDEDFTVAPRTLLNMNDVSAKKENSLCLELLYESKYKAKEQTTVFSGIFFEFDAQHTMRFTYYTIDITDMEGEMYPKGYDAQKYSKKKPRLKNNCSYSLKGK